MRSLDALPGKGWEEKAAAVGLWAAFAVDGGGGTDGPKQKMEWKIPSGQKIRGEEEEEEEGGQSWSGWMEGVISKWKKGGREGNGEGKARLIEPLFGLDSEVELDLGTEGERVNAMFGLPPPSPNLPLKTT